MVILDTSVIIDHLRQKKASRLELFVNNKPNEIFALSVVSIQELYEGKSMQDMQEEKWMLTTISPFKLLPYTYEIAQRAGEIAREIARTIETADAAIAAAAIVNGASLFTLDKHDFEGIPDLKLEFPT